MEVIPFSGCFYLSTNADNVQVVDIKGACSIVKKGKAQFYKLTSGCGEVFEVKFLLFVDFKTKIWDM